MKLYVIFGHGAGDCGACGNGYTEAERVRALEPYLKKYGGDNVEILDTSRNWYADNGISSLNIPSSDCLIEIHLDAASPSAMGGHIIIYKDYAPDNYDKVLASMLKEMFPGRSQLIVGRDDLANPNRAANKGINYRLIEVCFITNTSDISKYNNNLDTIAKGIVDCFGIGNTTKKEDLKPTETTTTNIPASSNKIESAKAFDKSFSRAYTCTDNLNLRVGAGTNKSIILTMPKGTKVVCYGYYSEVNGTKWLCISVMINKTNYTGYCSKDYLS